MNVVQENVNSLSAILKVKVTPEDYQNKVDNQLKEMQRKAAMPGFRPGKVPSGMVKKMYGKSILVEAINKMLNDTVYQHVKNNKLDILGQPLPSHDNNVIDWENEKEFEFTFELGLSPAFELNIENQNYEYKMIQIEESLVDKEIEDMKRRYGSATSPDSIENTDLVFGDFVEVNDANEPVDDGIKKTASVAIDKIKDEATKNNFLGLTRASHLIVDPHKISDNATDLGAMLGISKQDAEVLGANFKFTVTNISRMMPAELNQELYQKVYGESVTTIEEFRAKIKSELTAMFNNDSDRVFMNSVVKDLVEKHNLQLPEDFLKRWLVAASEKPVTMEQVSSEFPTYAERLKTQLLINKIIRQNGIEVKELEVRDFVKDLIKKQFASYNGMEMEETELDETATRVLSNEKEQERIIEKMYDIRLTDFFKNKLKLTFKEVPFTEFYQAS